MTYVLSLYLPTQSAGADKDVAAIVPHNCVIESATFVPDADVTANGTNYATLTLEANDGAGGAFAAIATARTTASVDILNDTGFAFTLTAPKIEAGQIVQLAKTYAASGVAVAGTLALTLRRVA